MITRAKLEAKMRKLWELRNDALSQNPDAFEAILDLINEMAHEMKIPEPDETTSAGGLLRMLRQLADYRKETSDHADEIERIEKRIKFELGPPAFELAGIKDKLTEKGVGTAKADIDTKAYVRKENEAAWFKFLRSKGVGSIIKETIHHTTLAKTVNDLVQNGTEMPDYVQVTRRECWNFRRNNSA